MDSSIPPSTFYIPGSSSSSFSSFPASGAPNNTSAFSNPGAALGLSTSGSSIQAGQSGSASLLPSFKSVSFKPAPPVAPPRSGAPPSTELVEAAAELIKTKGGPKTGFTAFSSAPLSNGSAAGSSAGHEFVNIDHPALPAKRKYKKRAPLANMDGGLSSVAAKLQPPTPRKLTPTTEDDGTTPKRPKPVANKVVLTAANYLPNIKDSIALSFATHIPDLRQLFPGIPKIELPERKAPSAPVKAVLPPVASSAPVSKNAPATAAPTPAPVQYAKSITLPPLPVSAGRAPPVKVKKSYPKPKKHVDTPVEDMRGKRRRTTRVFTEVNTSDEDDFELLPERLPLVSHKKKVPQAPLPPPSGRLAQRERDAYQPRMDYPTSYRAPSEVEMPDDDGGISDGDPPDFNFPLPMPALPYLPPGRQDRSYSNEIVVPIKAPVHPPAGPSTYSRMYSELEDITFATPQSFVNMAFAIASSRNTTLYVLDDRTSKVGSAYMHVACSQRKTGCPFILKLVRAKEGGWVMKSNRAIDVHYTARSWYSCSHEGASPDDTVMDGSAWTEPSYPPRARAATSFDYNGARPPAPILAKRPERDGYGVTSGDGRDMDYVPPLPPPAGMGMGRSIRVTSASGSGAEFHNNNISSSNSAPQGYNYSDDPYSQPTNGNPSSLARALAPPFERSLALQNLVQPVLRPDPARRTSQSAYNVNGYWSSLTSSNNSYPDLPILSSSTSHPAYERPRAYPLPFIAQLPVSIPPSPLTSMPQWTALLTLLDPELLPYASLLSSDVIGCTPDSFFAEQRAMRHALVESLPVSMWVKMKLRKSLLNATVVEKIVEPGTVVGAGEGESISVVVTEGKAEALWESVKAMKSNPITPPKVTDVANGVPQEPSGSASIASAVIDSAVVETVAAAPSTVVEEDTMEVDPEILAEEDLARRQAEAAVERAAREAVNIAAPVEAVRRMLEEQDERRAARTAGNTGAQASESPKSTTAAIPDETVLPPLQSYAPVPVAPVPVAPLFSPPTIAPALKAPVPTRTVSSSTSSGSPFTLTFNAARVLPPPVFPEPVRALPYEISVRAASEASEDMDIEVGSPPYDEE